MSVAHLAQTQEAVVILKTLFFNAVRCALQWIHFMGNLNYGHLSNEDSTYCHIVPRDVKTTSEIRKYISLMRTVSMFCHSYI